MADDRVYEEVYLPGSRRKTRILVKPNAGVEADKNAQILVDTLNHHSEHSDVRLKAGSVAVAESKEEAEDWAAEEAEAARVTPSAVMHSAPEGYASGARDQDQGTLTEDRVELLRSSDPFELAAEAKDNVELPEPPPVGLAALSEEEQQETEYERTSRVKEVDEEEVPSILVATGADKYRADNDNEPARATSVTPSEQDKAKGKSSTERKRAQKAEDQGAQAQTQTGDQSGNDQQ